MGESSPRDQARQQEWARQLDVEGRVAVRTSWPILLIMVLPVAVYAGFGTLLIVAAIDIGGGARLVAGLPGLALAGLAAGLLYSLAALLRSGRVTLIVDREGVQLRNGTRLRWSEIVYVDHVDGRRQFARAWPAGSVVRRWQQEAPRRRRGWARTRYVILASPGGHPRVFAQWLQWELDRRAAPLAEPRLLLDSWSDGSPVIDEETRASVPLSRLGLGVQTLDDLADWQRSARENRASSFSSEAQDEVRDTLIRPEGRELADRMAAELGPGASVQLLLDVLDEG